MVAIVGGSELGLSSASGQVLGGRGQLGSASQGRSGEGVTVNVVTGNLTLQRQDELLMGVGPDARLIRTYNSLGLLNDDNGDNWRLGYSRKVYGLTGTLNTAGSTIKRLGEDGAEVTYTYDASRSAYVTNKGAGAYDLLTFNSGANQWTWTDGSSQTKEIYDNANGGRLVQVRDTDNNTLTIGYNAAGLVSSIADANGETTYIDYDTAAGKTSNITQIRTVNSSSITLTRVRYGYDANNRLSTVTVDLSPENNSIADGKTYITTYTYDGNSTRLASVTQSDGSQLQFTYVLVGSDYRVETVKDVRGSDIRTTTFAYDTTARKTVVTDPVGQVTELTYDASGQLLSIKSPAVNGSSAVTSFTYDANGNVLSIIDGRGNTITYGYDSNGNRILERDAAGNTVTRTFDAFNQLLTETTYTTPDPDGAGTALPSGAITTRYVYDAEQHLRFVVSAEGRVTEYRYNTPGQQTSAINYLESVFALAGFTDGQSPSEAQMATWIAGVSAAKTARVDTVYDVRGQVSKVTTYTAVDVSGNGLLDGTQATTQYIYDQAGNLLQTISPRGVATTGIATDYLTTYTYDGLGRQLAATNALGQLTTVVYDDANRKTTITLANSLVTATTYDQAGNAVSVVRSGVEGALGTTVYTYDKLGRLVAQTDPSGVKQYFLYDALGRQVGVIDGTGAFTEYQYNAANQLSKTIRYTNAISAANLAAAATDASTLSVELVRPTTTTTDRISYNLYNSTGQLAKTIGAAGEVVQYQYDGAGRLVDTLAYSNLLTSTKLLALAAMTGEIAPNLANANPVSNAANDRRTRQFYSADGLLLATLDSEGYLSENLYNSAGQLTQTIRYATQTNSANWQTGSLPTLRPGLAAGDQSTFFIYNGRGQLVASVDAEGYLSENQYDIDGNKTAVIRYATKVSYTPGQTLAALRPTAAAEDQKSLYQYDALNQVTRSDSLPDGLVTTFTYDVAGNLTQTVKAFGATEARTQIKRYDSLGRVTQELSAEGAAALAALGATPTQVQIDAVWMQYGIKHSYDSAGRRISSVDALGNKTLYYYDADSRLTHTVNALGEVAESTYSLFGDVISTRRYGSRLSAASLGTLTGGLAGTTLNTALATISNAGLDSVELFTYGARGELKSRTDALGYDTLFSYNAFTQLIGRNTKLSSSGARLYEAFSYDRRGLGVSDSRDTNASWGAVAGVTTLVSRNYDAFGRLTSTVDARGNTWASTYDRLGRVITNTDPGTPARVMTYDAFSRVLTRQDALGNTTTYAYNTTNRSVSVTSPEGVVTTTVKNRHGDVVSVTDGRGNITSYTYDANGQLKTVTTPAGTTTTNYDKAGQKIEVVDANGIKTSYSYDAVGRVLTRSVDPTGLNLQTRTFYDAKGQSVWQQDANGIWTQTLYDLKGQVSSVIVDPLSIPDATSSQTTVVLVSNTSGLNLRTDYTYNATGKVVTLVEGVGSSRTQTTQYTYDNLGRLTQELVNPLGLKLKTQYSYDANDNLIAKTDALGYVTRFVYDDKNQQIYSVDATGAVVKFDYDVLGRVVQTTAYATAISLTSPSILGTVISASDITARLTLSAADRVNRSVYDRDGQVRFRIDANNVVTGLKYDAAGNLIQTTRYATAITLPGSLSVSSITTALVANVNDQVERTVYDVANRATFSIDAAGFVTQSVYDNVGHVIKNVRYATALVGTLADNVAPQVVATAPGSGAYVLTNASKDRLTRTVFDAAGRPRFDVDAEGYVTEHRYDAVGHELKRIQYSSKYTVADGATLASVIALLPATPGATEPVEQRIYDNAGRLSKVIDAEGSVTLHTYDASGNETDTVYAYGTSDASTTHRVFDGAGRLLEETVGYVAGTTEGSTSRYVLDAVGNRIQVIDPRGVDLAEANSAWALATRAALGYKDANGNGKTASTLTAAEKTALKALYTSNQQFDANGKITSLIDPFAKTISTQYDVFGNAVKVTDQRGYSGYFYFDKQNRLTLQIDPAGYVTQTFYNAFGTIDKVVHYANKVVGNPSTGSAPAIAATAPGSGAYLLENAANDQVTLIEHDKRNLQTKITDAVNAYETMAYDAFGNKVSYRNKVGGIFTYTYDRKGHVLTETQPITSLNASGVATAVVKGYQYDARGNITQLTEAVGLPEQRITQFQYDRLNRQTKKLSETFVSYNPVTQTDVSVTPTETQKYDGRGNLIESIDALGNRTLSYYDALNRKTAQLTALGQLTVWQYNDGTKPVVELAYTTPIALPTNAGGVPPSAAADGLARQKRFVYDANNRLITTLVPNVTLGTVTPGASNFSIITTDVVSQSIYDATGNEIQSIDARGGSVFSYYDALGHKVLQVDAENYVTGWQYDGSGNVVQQVQYATKLSLVASTGSDPLELVNSLSSSNDNRVTQFSYDKLGRVTEKRVLNVNFGQVNSTSGGLTTSSATSIDRYTYDGLGNVLTYSKSTSATEFAVTDYAYDSVGRALSEKSPGYSDYQGVTVRPQTDYTYNGLGLVRTEIERGLNNAVETDDCIIGYTYTVGGRLASQTDPTGALLQYKYDAAGNITQKSLIGRKNADGVVVNDVMLYQYDALNHEIWNKDVSSAEVRETRYNAYGEITGKRLNGGGAGGIWQETTSYDEMGRVWLSNSGDGVYKAYLYDANGNATLQIQSAGANFAGLTRAQVLALPANQTFITVSQYDKRNKLTDTYQPKMTGSHETLAVEQFITQQVGVAFSGGNISLGSSTQVSGRVETPSATTNAAALNGNISESYSLVGVSDSYYLDFIGTFTVNLPNLESLGAGGIRIVATPSYQGIAAPSVTQSYSGNPTQVSVGNVSFSFIYDAVNVQVYRTTVAGDLLIYDTTHTDIQATIAASANSPNHVGYGTGPSKTLKQIVFNGLPSNSDRLVLYTRALGSSDGWTQTSVQKLLNGTFVYDWSVLAKGNYEFRYVALDASSNVVNAQTGAITITDTTANVIQAPIRSGGGAGFALMDSTGSIQFMEQGSNVTSLTIRYRAANGSSWTTQTLTPATIGGVATPGWFIFNPATYGLTGKYDFVIEARDAYGTLVNTATSSFITGTPDSVFEDVAGIKHFTSPVTNGVDVAGTGNTTSTVSLSNHVIDPSYGLNTSNIDTTIQISPSASKTRVVVTYTWPSEYGDMSISASKMYEAYQTTGVLTIPDALDNFYTGPTSLQRIQLYRQTATGEELVLDKTLQAQNGTLVGTQTIAGNQSLGGALSAGTVVTGMGDTSTKVSISNLVVDPVYAMNTADVTTSVSISPSVYPTRVVVTLAPPAALAGINPLTFSWVLAPGQTTATATSVGQVWSWYAGGTQTVSVYSQKPTGEVLISSQSYATTDGATQTIAGVDTIDFSGQPAGTNRLYLMYHAIGSPGGWTVSNLPWNGNAFHFDWSNLPRGAYEFQYVALDVAGNVLNTEAGTMSLLDSSPAVVQNPKSLAGGLVVMDTGGKLQILGQGSTAQSMTVMYRAQGSSGVWNSVVINPVSPNGVAIPGWFAFDPAAYGLTGAFEYMLDAKDAGKNSLNRVQGTFTTMNPASVSPLKGYQNLPEIAHFSGQPAAAQTLSLYYRVNGSTGPFTKVEVPKVGTGAFDWDASGIISDRSANTQFEYRYETYGAGGLLLNSASGVLQLGLNPGMLSHTNQSDTDVKITPPQTDARKLSLYYRTNGSTGSFTRVDLTRTDATSAFVWDATALAPPGQTLSLDYYYTLANGAGTAILSADGNLVQVEGVINLGGTYSPTQLNWVVEGTANVDAVIHRTQVFNAFGEVIKEIDGRNNVTNFQYNALGLMVQKDDPETNITLRNGFVQRGRPTTRYYYDLAGRLVAVDDPNGNRNTLSLLTGSGITGDQPQIVAEFHADGGVKRSAYDVFGDARQLTDEVGRITLQEFDKAGRVTKLTRPQRVSGTASYISATALTELYEYDQLGNRIATTNELGKKAKTYFDSLGRVTKSTDYAGFSTVYGYSYQASTVLGVGGIAVGGYQKTTTLADGHVAIDNIEYFGRTTWHKDYGDHTFTYRYNQAGWLTEQFGSSGQSIIYDYYANGFQKSILDNVTGAFTQYEYDAEGNRTREAYTTTVNGQKTYYQVADITYDELNRVTRILDPKADIRYEYDANGNRRRVWSYYHDGVDGAFATREYWYDYDSMNRFTISMGALSTGARGTSASDTSVSIVKGTTGIQIGYNSASERVSAIYGSDGHREDYTYTADGYLEDTRINGVLRARRVNDAIGRVTSYVEFNASSAAVFSRTSTYNDANQLTVQQEWSTGKNTNTTYFDYYDTAGTTNNAGSLYTTTLVDGATTITTYYAYEWWDEAKQIAITMAPYNKNAPNWKSGYSQFTYDVNGHITSVIDPVGGRTLRYTTDAQGLVLTRSETAPGVNILHSYYYLDGKRIGDVGNDGPEDVSYAEELAARSDTRSRKDRYKSWTPISSADFDQNYQAITSTYPGGTPTSFTARAGDTLQSIAASVWGDSGMWYLIADANGLKGNETLKAGQVLVIPNKVTNIHNNSSTYAVYDAGETLGDTSPTLPDAPPPPKPKGKKKKCGGIGTILVVVVAVIVTIYTAGAASGAFASLGAGVGGASGAAAVAGATSVAGTMSLGAAALAGGVGMAGFAGAIVGGAIGAIASQGLAMSMGMQDKFSWSGVALGAIGAGVGAGISQLDKIGVFANIPGGEFGRAIATSVTGNSATQSIAVATGLQEKFSWTAVAASAVGGAVGYGVGESVKGSSFGLNEWGAKVARGTLTSMANGGAQQLVSGQRPNWALIAAESFGSALGNNIVEKIAQEPAVSLNQQEAGNGMESTSGSSDSAAIAYAAPQEGKPISGSINSDSVALPYDSSWMEDEALFSSGWDPRLESESLGSYVRPIRNTDVPSLDDSMDLDVYSNNQEPEKGIKARVDEYYAEHSLFKSYAYDGDFVNNTLAFLNNVGNVPVNSASAIGNLILDGVDEVFTWRGGAVPQTLDAFAGIGTRAEAVKELAFGVRALRALKLEAKLTADVPFQISREQLGAFLGHGGSKTVYAYGDYQAVGVLRRGGSIDEIHEELANIKLLKDAGIPVVEARGPIFVSGQPAIAYDAYALGSKEVVEKVGRSMEIVGESSFLNERSIRDLQMIRSSLIEKNIHVHDLQFLISKSGRVVVADPLKVVLNTAPSKTNKRTINLLIEAAERNIGSN